jgi:hypothetical protein
MCAVPFTPRRAAEETWVSAGEGGVRSGRRQRHRFASRAPARGTQAEEEQMRRRSHEEATIGNTSHSEEHARRLRGRDTRHCIQTSSGRSRNKVSERSQH